MSDPEPPDPPPAGKGDPGAANRTGMAAERTWLAWWRTALAATAGALAVGRLAPEVLHVAAAPYIVLGCGYAVMAIGLLLVGAIRQRDLQRAVEEGRSAPVPFIYVAIFTLAGTALAVMTIVLVIARS